MEEKTILVPPPTFEEAAKSITDPNYGLGLTTIWQLPDNWCGTKAAKIHDLWYDYLEPGDNTEDIDRELIDGFIAEGMNIIERETFYVLVRARGRVFEIGPNICALRKGHNLTPCSYGQAGRVYDLRCITCGLHVALDDKRVVEIKQDVK